MESHTQPTHAHPDAHTEPAPIAVPTLTPRHAHAWGSPGDDHIQAILADGHHALIAGTFEQTLTLGTHTLTSAGGSDIFVARVAPASGQVQWAQRIGGPGDDTLGGLARISERQIAFAASFEDALELNGKTLTSAGKKDILVATLDTADGTLGWTHTYGGEGVDVAASLAAHNGTLALAGYFMKQATLGSHTLQAQSADVLIASLDATTGDVRWARGFGGESSDKASAVEIAPNGDLIVTGAFRKDASLGGDLLSCAGSRDAFLARYNPRGDHLWSLRFGGEGTDQGNALALTPTGEIALAGFFQGSMSLAGETFQSGHQRNPLIAYFAADGTPVWAHGHRSDMPAEATAIALTDDALWVAGTFQGEIDLGGGLMTSDNVSQDLFLVRESLDHGVHRASLWLGGEGRDNLSDIAITPDHLLLVGSFEQSTAYAGHTFRSKGGSDAWISAVAR